jgi:hypothetical protein
MAGKFTATHLNGGTGNDSKLSMFKEKDPSALDF